MRSVCITGPVTVVPLTYNYDKTGLPSLSGVLRLPSRMCRSNKVGSKNPDMLTVISAPAPAPPNNLNSF